MHTIELKKAPSAGQPVPLDEWHSLFNAETEEELDMIKSKTKNPGIIEAIKELREVSRRANCHGTYDRVSNQP